MMIKLGTKAQRKIDTILGREEQLGDKRNGLQETVQKESSNNKLISV